MLSRIRNLADYGKAVVISTHILPDVQAVCDNVVILVGGRLQLCESLEKLRMPFSNSYQARVLNNREEFVQMAQQDGINVDRADDGTLTLQLNDEQTTDNIWAWAQQANCTIRSLQPARNSLEEIFVNAVREAGRAD